MLNEIHGSIDSCSMEFIIRDHDKEKFESKKQLMRDVVDFINKKHGNIVELKLEDSYYNMKEMVEPHKEILDLAISSMKNLGIEPIVKPIRGGTDGARLSYMGLPCPNIFTGGYNFHGRFEMIPIEDMKKASELIVEIAKNAVQD